MVRKILASLLVAVLIGGVETIYTASTISQIHSIPLFVLFSALLIFLYTPMAYLLVEKYQQPRYFAKLSLSLVVGSLFIVIGIVALSLNEGRVLSLHDLNIPMMTFFWFLLSAGVLDRFCQTSGQKTPA